MPSWGGKNRPLPDTGKRNMLGRQQDFAAPHKDGRPRRKAAQEGKAAKDTEDPLVKLERVVELLDRGLLSVREYELLKQHILTDLLSTALGWPPTAQDQGRGGGRPLEDAGSFTARARGRSASEVGTGRVREVVSSTRTPASVLHAKSQNLEPTVAVEPAQHGAKVDGGSRRPPAFAAEPLEPISCSPTAVGATVAVQSHVKVQARTVMARGRQQEASKPSATSPRWAAATRCGAKGPSNVGEGAKTRPLARGRARGERRSPSAAHASSGWGRSIPADRLDISSSTAGAQRTVSREFIMGWGRGKSAAQQFSSATARGAIVSSSSDRELVRKFVRESILGVPENYQVPYFLKPRKDPFAGEWDPDWVVLGGFDNDEQPGHSSAGGLVDAVADAAGATNTAFASSPNVITAAAIDPSVTPNALVTDTVAFNTSTFKFIFYNNTAGLAVPDSEAVKQFDNVPTKSKALEIAKNRLFLN